MYSLVKLLILANLKKSAIAFTQRLNNINNNKDIVTYVANYAHGTFNILIPCVMHGTTPRLHREYVAQYTRVILHKGLKFWDCVCTDPRAHKLSQDWADCRRASRRKQGLGRAQGRVWPWVECLRKAVACAECECWSRNVIYPKYKDDKDLWSNIPDFCYNCHFIRFNCEFDHFNMHMIIKIRARYLEY